VSKPAWLRASCPDRTSLKIDVQPKRVRVGKATHLTITARRVSTDRRTEPVDATCTSAPRPPASVETEMALRVRFACAGKPEGQRFESSRARWSHRDPAGPSRARRGGD
jgi:hypothetical protein